MTEKTISLDEHRGMAAQRATAIRRARHEVEADQAALRRRRTEFEKLLGAAPASCWAEAAEKARYLIQLFAATAEARDPRRRQLIASVLGDLDRLAADPEPSDEAGGRPGGPPPTEDTGATAPIPLEEQHEP
jgi:hypothetical protein